MPLNVSLSVSPVIDQEGRIIGIANQPAISQTGNGRKPR